MKFIKRLVLVVTALAVVLVPGAAFADDGDDGCAFTPPHTLPAIDDKYSWNCPLDGP